MDKVTFIFIHDAESSDFVATQSFDMQRNNKSLFNQVMIMLQPPSDYSPIFLQEHRQ